QAMWPPGGAAARRPAFRASQASSGQVTVCTVVVTSEPIEPAVASRQMAGVFDGEMSLQRRPPMPITMTGLAAGVCAAADGPLKASAATAPAARATMPALILRTRQRYRPRPGYDVKA